MRPSVGQCASLACLWEATAAKPGNVHRGADFGDMTFADFEIAAVAIGPVFDRAGGEALGSTVLNAVRAMRSAVGVNTHLGTILLLAPLAKGAAEPGGAGLVEKAAEIANAAGVEDCRLVYEAIRRALPGGMGRVEESDVSSVPSTTLIDAMQLAAERDLVARQYVNGFEDVAAVAEQIAGFVVADKPLCDAIVRAHVWQMARCPDSLIARKCGPETAAESAARATGVIQAAESGEEEYNAALADFDFWLRSDGHRRNPGTTADLIGAALFVLLAESRIGWPIRFYGDRYG